MRGRSGVLLLGLIVATAAGPSRAQEPPDRVRGIVDVLEGREGGPRPPTTAGGAPAPAPAPPEAARQGWLHEGRRLAGRYQALGPFEVEAQRVLEHLPGRRLRVALALRSTLGAFSEVAPADPRLRVVRARGLGGERLEVEVVLDGAGAVDDVRARLLVRTRTRARRVTGWLTVDLVVGHDPVDIAQDIIRRDRWRWQVAGGDTTDYERWLDGAIHPDAMRTANCYQFVKFALHGAGVPERPRPQPTLVVNGVERPTTEEGLAYQQGHRRGSPAVDAASIERGLRDYVHQFAGHYRRAPEGHAPRRGDLVIYYVRDGSGTLQASHVGMYTGEGQTIVHNAGRGPSTLGVGGRVLMRLRYDAIATFEYVGHPALESR